MGRSTSKTETIVALDLATKCGWAVLEGRKRVDSGRETLRRGKEHRGARWANFDAFLSELVATYNPEVLAFERVRRHVGTSAAHVYGGLLAGIERFEHKRLRDDVHGSLFHPEIVPIEISTWRKAACGRGDIIKEEVVKWAKRRFRYLPHTDDEAEALAIAEAIRKIRSGEYTT